jgi:hypothetical protein
MPLTVADPVPEFVPEHLWRVPDHCLLELQPQLRIPNLAEVKPGERVCPVHVRQPILEL